VSEQLGEGLAASEGQHNTTTPHFYILFQIQALLCSKIIPVQL